MRFVGRKRELQALQRELSRVSEGSGRCLLVRGRRRVGKSRLLEEFCQTAGAAYVVFTASQQGAHELGLFTEEIAQSTLTGRDVFLDANPTTWDAALRLLAAAVDPTAPSIVVIDEFPYLAGDDPTIEATFQKHWDRHLSKLPVLLVLVGSDLAMMEALNSHGRAFFQRGTELVVPPFTPTETGALVGARSASDAFDAYLVTGGLPLIGDDWTAGLSLNDYLHDALNRPTSPLIVSGERVLAAEFPTEALARDVLAQIGSGEVTFTHIARATGGLQATSLTRALDTLAAKRVVAKDSPVSTKPSRDPRYRIVDPYLRFWLRFIGPHLAEIERGRSDRVLARIERDWVTWRGKAIEPVIREALLRLSPIDGLPPADYVGGYWTRTNVPEIDIVAADRGPVAKHLQYAGTVKWLDNAPLDQGDVNQLVRDLAALPGATPDLPLLAVSRSGVTASGVVTLGPEELLAAW